MRLEIPSEYRKGFTKFLNCKVDLSKRVFIPRIETEFWVNQVIKEIQKFTEVHPLLKVLDIFAGSGCIGIAILKNIKNSSVDFVDIDKKAIEQIRINLKLNNISKFRYKIYQSNLFEKINGKYDVIFANPPYVARERIKEVESSVLKYEPKIALLAGKRGMQYIKKFLKGARNFLKPKGVIYLELDPLQEKEIEDILNREKYKNFKFFKDQFKKYRFLKVKKNN